MEKIYNIFKTNKYESDTETSKLTGSHKSSINSGNKKYDSINISYFKSLDLSRKNFKYEILKQVGWWPDEILTFLEILNISYLEFINDYMNTSDIFDTAIRNTIFFMHQKKYNKQSDIRRYLKHGNYEIRDNYLNQVLSEDNCYMYELEDRERSPNEEKHYLLFKALQQILKSVPISDGDTILKSEYEMLIRKYVMVYKLKNAYAVLDDHLRKILNEMINGETYHEKLSGLIEGLLEDVMAEILPHFIIVNDNKIYDKINIYRDILLFALHKTLQFDHVFNLEDNLLSPFGNDKYKVLFSDNTTGRIQYVYGYYLNILSEKEKKNQIIESNEDFNDIIHKIKTETSTEKIISPRYSPRSVSLSSKNSKQIFIVSPEELNINRKITKKIDKHFRKHSIDSLINGNVRKNFGYTPEVNTRQDLPGNQ